MRWLFTEYKQKIFICNRTRTHTHTHERERERKKENFEIPFGISITTYIKGKEDYSVRVFFHSNTRRRCRKQQVVILIIAMFFNWWWMVVNGRIELIELNKCLRKIGICRWLREFLQRIEGEGWRTFFVFRWWCRRKGWIGRIIRGFGMWTGWCLS